MMIKERNELYPIFLKTKEFRILVVGGGKVALEKLTFLLKSSPLSNVVVISPSFLSEIEDLAANHEIELIRMAYDPGSLARIKLVIAATDNPETNREVCDDARKQNILVNVADTPDLCDFYLGGIVTKGNLKIAISTNGKSPTMAKRLRQFFEDILPEDVDKLLLKLHDYRKKLKGDFDAKVTELNRVTETFLK